MALDKTGLTRFWQHIVARLGTKVDKVEGKGLSTNDFTTEEKNKLASIESGATKTIVDEALSSSSTNPVQNAAVASAVDDINNRLGESSVSDQIVAYAAPISHTHNYAGSSSAGGAATSAEKLATARAITLSGAVNGTVNFDGSGNANIPTTFPENITIPGTITANKVIGAVYM